MIVYVNWNEEEIISSAKFERMVKEKTDSVLDLWLSDSMELNDILEDMDFDLAGLFKMTEAEKEQVISKVEIEAENFAREELEFEEYELEV